MLNKGILLKNFIKIIWLKMDKKNILKIDIFYPTHIMNDVELPNWRTQESGI